LHSCPWKETYYCQKRPIIDLRQEAARERGKKEKRVESSSEARTIGEEAYHRKIKIRKIRLEDQKAQTRRPAVEQKSTLQRPWAHTIEDKRGLLLSKETYYCQKRPTTVKRDMLLEDSRGQQKKNETCRWARRDASEALSS
jgi:hypothetical protein